MDKLWLRARRAISVLLVFTMLASVMPVQAFAEDTAPAGTDGAAAVDAAPEVSEPSQTDSAVQETTETENSEEAQEEAETEKSPAAEAEDAAEGALEETMSPDVSTVTGELPQEDTAATAPTPQEDPAAEEPQAPDAEAAAPETEPAAEAGTAADADSATDAVTADTDNTAGAPAAEETAEPETAAVSRRTLTESVEGTTVSVTAELPADTQLVVTKMSGDDLGDNNMQALMEAVNSNDIREIEAYEISLTDGQGNVCALPEGRTADVTLQGISLQAAEGQTLYAAHLKADGSADMGKVSGSTVTFTVDSFSPFVVVTVDDAETASAAENAQEKAAAPEKSALSAQAGTYAAPAATYAAKYRTYFVNSTTDPNVEIWYSTDGQTLNRMANGGTISFSRPAWTSSNYEIRAIQFYIITEPGYDYQYCTFNGTDRVEDGVLSLDDSKNEHLGFHGEVDFTQANQAAKEMGAKYAFHFSGNSLTTDLINGSDYVQKFLVSTNWDQQTVKIVYHRNISADDQTQEELFADLHEPGTLWQGEMWNGQNGDKILTGWNTRQDGSGVQYGLSDLYTPEAPTQDLYATWAEPTVTVTYNANSGSWDGSSVLTQTPDRGSNYTVTKDEPTRSGYEFQGWNTRVDGSGTGYRGGDVICGIQSDLTLYAQWKNVRKYTVNVTLSTVSGTVLKQTRKNPVQWDELTGYQQMSGDQLANALLGTHFTAGSKVNTPVWSPAEPDEATLTYQVTITIADESDDLVTVTYAASGADGTLPAGTTLVKGDAYTVEGQGSLTKTNYTFAGWKNSADNRVYSAEHADGKTIAAVNTDITLTAQWEQILYQIRYEVTPSDSGTVQPASEEVGAGNQATGSTATAGEGWYFVKWTDESGAVAGNDPVLHPGTVSGNKVYTANFARQAEITVKAGDLQKTYDGKAAKADNRVELTAGTLADGHTLQATTAVTPDVVNVNQTGVQTISTLKVVDRAGNDVTYLYHITRLDGTVTITPKAVTVTADNKSKTYGEADPELTATVEGTLNGDRVAYELDREDGSDVGTYPITVTGETNQGNYQVTFVEGVFTIGKARLTDAQANATGFSLPYDGQAHSIQVVNTVKAEVAFTVNGEATTADATNVSDSRSKVVVTFTSPNYETKTVTVDKVITPKAVTVTADNKSKTYGEADPELTATVEGTLNGDRVQYELDREDGSDVGTYPITVTGETNQGNYQVTFVEGNLAITARPVTITARDAYKLAGGADPDFKAAFGAVVDNAVNGETPDFTIVRTGTEEEAGLYRDELAVRVTEDSAVNRNYAITTVNGDLTVFADAKGTADPADPAGETGDGIPDAFQTVFRYGSAGNGTVTGQTYEVYTADGWQDNWQTAAKPVVQPKAEIEVSSVNGYTFTGFTAGQGENWADIQAIRTLAATDRDTVFTANFAIRADLSYTVRYLEDGTARVLAGEKTVGGQTFGAVVTESAPDIAGYTLTSNRNPQSITIGTGDNVITFYYKAAGEAEAAAPAAAGNSAAPLTVSGTPAAPAAPAAAGTSPAPAATAAPQEELTGDEGEQIGEEETPLAPDAGKAETIGDEQTPLAGSADTWAMLNLILAVLTALGGLLLALGYFLRRKHNAWRLAALVPAVGAVAAFLLTEDLSRTMAFADKWTLLMVLLAAIQAVVAVLGRKEQ